MVRKIVPDHVNQAGQPGHPGDGVPQGDVVQFEDDGEGGVDAGSVAVEDDVEFALLSEVLEDVGQRCAREMNREPGLQFLPQLPLL